MIIWNASASRTGRTLCTRVVGALLETRQIPSQPLAATELTPTLPRRFNSPYVGGSDGAWWTDVFPQLSQRLHLYFVRRDLRDALISYLKLVKADFHTALTGYYQAACIYDRYETLPVNSCLKLSYEQDLLHLPSLVTKLGNFLGLTPTPAEIATLTQQLARQQVQQAILQYEATFFNLMAEYTKPPAGPSVLIELWHNNVLYEYFIPRHQVQTDLSQPTALLTFRVQDRTYTVTLNMDDRTVRLLLPDGWQQDHISSPPEGGEWRHLLTSHQIREMNAKLGTFLVKWGYTISFLGFLSLMALGEPIAISLEIGASN